MPACDSGVSICSLMGRSILPVSSTAMSWHPPHHFEGLVPIMSCMYSIDLRYHWLLKDEKWCIEPSHCLTMSGWQVLLPHADCESRKKSEGRYFAPIVSLEE